MSLNHMIGAVENKESDLSTDLVPGRDLFGDVAVIATIVIVVAIVLIVHAMFQFS